MEKETDVVETEDGVVVPAPARLRVLRGRGLGGVAGLDDSELANPSELARVAMIEDWWPVLSLPVQGKSGGFSPEMDESGQLDWGSLGSADIEKLVPQVDKAQSKVDKLREELKDALIMLSMVKLRVPGQAKYVLIGQLRKGVIELDQITDENMRAIAKWYLRARRTQQELFRAEQGRRR